MASYVDYLKNNNPEELVLELAIGRHIVAGDLSKSYPVTGGTRVQNMLGEGYGKGWKGISQGIWFRGARLGVADFNFHPGIMSSGLTDPVQGVDPTFPEDVPHSNTAWISFFTKAVADNETDTPEGLRAITDCQLMDIYDAAGNISAANQYSTNAADAAAFLLKIVARYPNSRINWASLDVVRKNCAQSSIVDYRTLPMGIGVTGDYYQGTAFQTFVLSRTDPVIEFPSSTGSPAFTLAPDNFSVKFAGWIKPKFTETYTFYLTHDNGGRLYIDDVNKIDFFTDAPPATHTATHSMTANQFYKIDVHWNDFISEAAIKLEWESPSQPRQVVPQSALYPKNGARTNYECHVAIKQPTDIDTALRAILRSSNAFYQETDGQFFFYSYDTLVPTFTFNETNIITETFTAYQRYSQTDLRNAPTRYQADGLDLDSPYLEKFDPPVFVDLPERQNLDLGHIRTKTVDVGNCHREQVIKNLELEIKLDKNGWIVEFEGMPQTFPVLENDLVYVNWARKNWILKKFLVMDATDKSIDGGADERIFRLLEWS